MKTIYIFDVLQLCINMFFFVFSVLQSFLCMFGISLIASPSDSTKSMCSSHSLILAHSKCEMLPTFDCHSGYPLSFSATAQKDQLLSP